MTLGGLTWPLEISKEVTDSGWYGALTNRAKEVVGFAADDKFRQGKAIQYCDIYHSANRYATGDHHVPIILPRSILWSFPRSRLVLGRESLALQGHAYEHESISDLQMTESQLQDLAGNA